MKIGIIAAMNEESELLKNKMSHYEENIIAGVSYISGVLNNKNIVLATSGIGKVNAAICTQIMISEFKVRLVINTGVSGAIDESLNVGDVVISTDCMQHDIDCTAFGYNFGVIPRLESSIFVADIKLVDSAFDESKKLLTQHKVVKGRIVSGDQFISSKEKKIFLKEKFAAYATEMEGGAIAHVCYVNQIPYVIIRSMSDTADGEATIDYNDFVKEAANRSSSIVLNMINNLSV